MTSDHVLITGAAGFLGSIIVRKLYDSGFSITATDRVVCPGLPRVNFFRADILDPLSLSEIFEGVTCVCHVAGLAHIFNKYEALGSPFNAVNVVGTKNVANAAARAGVEHFLFISSVSVYGGVAHGKNEDSGCYPESSYAQSKWQAERCLSAICQDAGIKLTILRLATLYGEQDPGNVARLIRSIDRGRFVWVGKGENAKSLLHRDDAARACIAAIEAPVSGINIYNVSAPPCRMCDVVAAIARALGRPTPSWHVPAFFALNLAKILKIVSFNRGRLSVIYETVQKWLADDYYNTDKFSKTFKFETKVRLEEGILREVEWLKRRC